MSALFDAAREAFLDGDLDWSAQTFKVYLIDHADDNPDVAVDDFLDDVAAGARVAGPVTLTTSSPLGTGVADADDISFTAATGDQSEALLIYRDTGVEGTSNLVAEIDSATGLPVTPNGGDIDVTWDSGANRIFKL
jgi:hypothetical protein